MAKPEFRSTSVDACSIARSPSSPTEAPRVNEPKGYSLSGSGCMKLLWQQSDLEA